MSSADQVANNFSPAGNSTDKSSAAEESQVSELEGASRRRVRLTMCDQLGGPPIPPRLLSENASMDLDMRKLEVQMRNKREEEAQLGREAVWNLSTVTTVGKQLAELQEREKFYGEVMGRTRLDNSSSDLLDLVVVRNLRALSLAHEQVVAKWRQVVDQCKENVAAHQISYSSLPWVYERGKRIGEVENNRILSTRMEMLANEIGTNCRLAAQIHKRRLTTEVVRLAELMADWRRELNEEARLTALLSSSRSRLVELEDEKIRLRAISSSRMREMIFRIVDRMGADGPQPFRQAPPAAPNSFQIGLDDDTAPISTRGRLGIVEVVKLTPREQVVQSSRASPIGGALRSSADSTRAVLQLIGSQAAKLLSSAARDVTGGPDSAPPLHGSRQAPSDAAKSPDIGGPAVEMDSTAPASLTPTRAVAIQGADPNPEISTSAATTAPEIPVDETEQTSAVQVDSVMGAKRQSESEAGAGEPKKPKPAPHTRTTRARTASKRVSFETERTAVRGEAPAASMTVHSSEAADDSNAVAERSCKVASTQREDNQPPPVNDNNFQHLFSPSPQKRGSCENFESLFGAIFNTSATSREATDEFNFSAAGADKHGVGSSSAAPPQQSAKGSTAPEFFSFFGSAPSTSTEGPKDNFFKLF